MGGANDVATLDQNMASQGAPQSAFRNAANVPFGVLHGAQTSSPDVKSPGSDVKSVLSSDLRAGVTTTALSQDLLVMGSSRLKMLHDEGFYIPLDELEFMGSLGSGGFAVVEKARWKQPGSTAPRLVAVKKLKADVINDERELAAFAQEMAILKTIKHRNIAEFLGAGGTDDPDHIHDHPPYMVQELVEGGSLKQMLYKQALANPTRLYSERTALQWMLDVAEGLEHLHSLRPKVIHRDLKPDNVLLNGSIINDSTAKLVDFGLATVAARRRSFNVKLIDHMSSSLRRMNTLEKLASSKNLGKTSSNRQIHLNLNGTFSSRRLQRIDSEKEETGGMASRLRHSISRRFGSSGRLSSMGSTHVPSILDEKFALSKATGSYFYMAPEVYRGDNYNEMVDVFSFAVIMYELMHRKVMMSTVILRGTFEEVQGYAARVAGGYRPPFHPNLNPAVQQLIENCWAAESFDRPSMTEVVKRLRAILVSGEISAESDEAFGCAGAGCVVS